MRQFIIASAIVGLLATSAMADVLRVPKDFATIQAAVDAASNGDKIIIASGTYAENVDVNGIDNLLIRGKGAVVIAPAAGDALTIDGCSGTRVQKVRVNGPDNGLVCLDSPDTSVERCRGAGKIVFAAAGASGGTTFLRCRATTEEFGFVVIFATGAYRIERCKIASSSAGQAILAASERITLIRCGVVYTGAPTDEPILIQASVRGLVDRCKVDAPPSPANIAGISVQSAGASPENTVSNSRVDGMRIGITGNADGTQVIANRITGASYRGIDIDASGWLVDRNKVLLAAPVTAAGIFVQSGSNDDHVIRRNKVSGTGACVVLLSSDDCVVAKNVFKSSMIGVTLTGNNNTVGPGNRFVAITGTNLNDGGVGTVFIP